MKIRPVGAEFLQAGRRKDMKMLIVAFRVFANAIKNWDHNGVVKCMLKQYSLPATTAEGLWPANLMYKLNITLRTSKTKDSSYASLSLKWKSSQNLIGKIKTENIAEKFNGIYLVAHLIACTIDCDVHVEKHVSVMGIDAFLSQVVQDIQQVSN